MHTESRKSQLGLWGFCFVLKISAPTIINILRTTKAVWAGWNPGPWSTGCLECCNSTVSPSISGQSSCWWWLFGLILSKAEGLNLFTLSLLLWDKWTLQKSSLLQTAGPFISSWINCKVWTPLRYPPRALSVPGAKPMCSIRFLHRNADGSGLSGNVTLHMHTEVQITCKMMQSNAGLKKKNVFRTSLLPEILFLKTFCRCSSLFSL